MDAAKSNLAQAQKDADEQIKIVDEDSQMASDGNVKAAYDALKNVNNESHSISTTVTADSYDEAVASIEKAKAADQKATDVKNAQEALKNAIASYQSAKAAQAAASQRPSSNSGSQSRPYSTGGGSSSGSTGGSSSSNGGSSSGGSSSGGSQTQNRTGDESWRQYVKHGNEIKPGMHCYIVGKDQYLCS